MRSFSICLSFALFLGVALGAEWCYKDAEGCGPNTPAWPEPCHSGVRQSPIDIPRITQATAVTHLKLGSYRGPSFRMVNNGHSVQIDFHGMLGFNAELEWFPFPDPTTVGNQASTRKYRFDSAHLHWGSNNGVGSEHTVAGRSSALELHLVHYLADYPNKDAAVASGAANALVVVGVLIDAPSIPSKFGQIAVGPTNPALLPILRNLNKVREAHHSGGEIQVREPIDLTPLLITELPAHVYSYKGSLTTPGCNEQVNWFVLRKPAQTSTKDVEKLRAALLDGHGEPLTDNHRPVKPLNGRKVYLSTVFPA